MRKKEKLDRQGQAKNLFGSYSPEYQQLIEGINLVLQLSLSTMSPSLPSLDKAIPPVNTQSKIFSQAVKTTASALRYVIKRSFAAFLSSKKITVRHPSLADLALRSSHPLPGPLKPSQSLAPAEDIQVIIQEVQLLR